MTTHCRIACLIWAVCCEGTEVWAAGMDRGPVRAGRVLLRNVRWQALPHQVRRVFVGPDQRIWLELWPRVSQGNMAALRRLIESEFSAQQPELASLRPALFEPGGRVWFVDHWGKVLIGYDGSRWVERAPMGSCAFVGDCPGHGLAYKHSHNVWADGCAFFPDTDGVHCFDGKRWSYERLVGDRIHGGCSAPILRVEPDGKGVLAILPGCCEGFWRWRQGAWVRIRLELDCIRDLAPARDDRAWLFVHNGGLHVLPYGQRGLAAQFSNLLKRLQTAPDDDARAAVCDSMIQCDVGVVPHLRKTLSGTYDHRVTEHLLSVLEALLKPGRCQPLGTFRALHTSLLYYDNVKRTAYIGGKNVCESDRPLGTGLLTVDRTGRARFLPGDGLVQGWSTSTADDSGPLMTVDGSGVWIPRAAPNGGPRLLDLTRADFVDSLPDPRCVWLHAVKADGTVFAGWRDPARGGPLMAYRPKAREDRRAVAAPRVELDSDQFCVASDGAIWASLKGRGPARFNGTSWETPAGLRVHGPASFFLPGRDGTLLTSTGKDFVFLASGRARQHPRLRILIKECREDIVRAFAGRSVIDCADRPLALAVDRLENIWLLEFELLHVLVSDRWIATKQALLKVVRDYTPAYLSCVGDESTIYVTDCSPQDEGGSAAYGRVVDGAVAFSPAPGPCDEDAMARCVRDAEGGLWVPGRVGVDRFTYRIVRPGQVQEIRNAGWPRLCDRGGNVWLGGAPGRPGNEFRLWREGRIARTIVVPSADEDTILVSDSPGSVLALTCLGICHLRCRDAADPLSFEATEVYAPTGVLGSVIAAEYTDLGYLAVATYVSGRQAKYYLHLVPLPNRQER